jgi:hypothetical protein
VATSLKALKERLPIPALAEWLLSQPERIENMYQMHGEDTATGRCASCGAEYECNFRVWAKEAKEYLEAREMRMRVGGKFPSD